MTSATYQVDFKPGKIQVDQLKIWMLAENQQNTGIIHYLEILDSHAKKDTLATVTNGGEAIGFVTWDTYMQAGHIAVAALSPQHRRSGAGRVLINALYEHLISCDLLALYLECAPPSSEPFWRKMGFKQMPVIDGYSDGDEPCLYRTLVDSQEPEAAKGEHIQVNEWGSKEKVTWPVVYRKGTDELVKPIIIPASGDWLVAHVKTSPPEHPDKIKYFQSGLCYHAPFLILTRL